MGCVFSQEQDERKSKHYKDRRHPSQQQQQPQKQIRPQQQQQQKQQIQQVNGNHRSAENGTQIKLQTGIKTTIIAGKP